MRSILSVAAVSLVLSSAVLAKEPLVQVEPPPPVDPWLGYVLGVQYEYSDMDLHLDGDKQNFDIQAVYGTFDVPLSPRWDFLVRLGGANASSTDFDGRTDWAWGIGLHATIAVWDEFTLEAKGQISSLTSSAGRTITIFDSDLDPNYYKGTDELSLFEYNLMVGPTWSRGPLSLRGGAMLRYMTGDFDFTVSAPSQSYRKDVDHDFLVGGYLGGTFDVNNSIAIKGDLQADGQLLRLSAGLIWRL
jgi:hypothetical protein